MYKTFIEIKVYDYELPTYKLLTFLLLQFFSLEFIRKNLNVDDVHFVSKKQKAQFELKARVSTFIVNTRDGDKELESLLAGMKFKLSFSWHYDPMGKILAIEQKIYPYIHTSKPERKIEQFDNTKI